MVDQCDQPRLFSPKYSITLLCDASLGNYLWGHRAAWHAPGAPRTAGAHILNLHTIMLHSSVPSIVTLLSGIIYGGIVLRGMLPLAPPALVFSIFT